MAYLYVVHIDCDMDYEGLLISENLPCMLMLHLSIQDIRYDRHCSGRNGTHEILAIEADTHPFSFVKKRKKYQEVRDILV